MRTLLLIMITSVSAGAKNPSITEILANVDRAERFGSFYAEMKQVITTTSGQERVLLLRSWAVGNNEKQLAEYLQPADIRGQRILMTDFGDNIWMFNPETRRTRKLGSHMRKRKVMGSDFTYEDQATGRMNERYGGKVLRGEPLDRVECWVVELIPKPSGPSYGKVVAWIGKADSVLRRADYYEERDDAKPFKRLTTGDIRRVAEARPSQKPVVHFFPFEMTMTNLEDNTRTQNLAIKVQLGANIPERIFEARNLEKTR